MGVLGVEQTPLLPRNTTTQECNDAESDALKELGSLWTALTHKQQSKVMAMVRRLLKP